MAFIDPKDLGWDEDVRHSFNEETGCYIDRKFLRNKSNRALTKTLFWQHSNRSPNQPVYCLEREDHTVMSVKGYRLHILSARKIYLEARDPTEYEAAKRLVGSWDTWQSMVEAYWFKPHLERWRRELAIMLESEALQTLSMAARQTDAKGVNAAKFFANKEYEKDGKKSVKEVKKMQEAEQAEKVALDETDEDLKRLGIDLNGTMLQ